MNDQPTVYPFQDGLLAPPILSDNPNQSELQKHVNDSLIQFPEQVEQELALFAFNILENAKNEYNTYYAFKHKNSNDQIINELARKRMASLENQLSNLRKVQYLAENYKEEAKKVNKKEEEDGELDEEEDEAEDF